MTILKLSDLRDRSRRSLFESNEKIAKSLLDVSGPLRWKAFLSYRSIDRETAFSAAELLKSTIVGLSIYVDEEDPDITPGGSMETAERLRARITESDLLIVAVTSGSPNSRWMPWELGIADGGGIGAAVLPCVKSLAPYGHDGLEFEGQEYLGVYPWLDVHASTEGTWRAWANTRRDTYVVFEDWMEGEPPARRSRGSRQ